MAWLILILPCLQMGPHLVYEPKADTSGQAGCIHISKTKQMFSDVWSNICFLPSCPSSPSSDSSCKAWWHQQMLQMSRLCCEMSASFRLFPTATIFVPRLNRFLIVSITARRLVCEVPGCRRGLEQSVGRGDPCSSFLPFFPEWTI